MSGGSQPDGLQFNLRGLFGGPAGLHTEMGEAHSRAGSNWRDWCVFGNEVVRRAAGPPGAKATRPPEPAPEVPSCAKHGHLARVGRPAFARATRTASAMANRICVLLSLHVQVLHGWADTHPALAAAVLGSLAVEATEGLVGVARELDLVDV